MTKLMLKRFISRMILLAFSLFGLLVPFAEAQTVNGKTCKEIAQSYPNKSCTRDIMAYSEVGGTYIVESILHNSGDNTHLYLMSEDYIQSFVVFSRLNISTLTFDWSTKENRQFETFAISHSGQTLFAGMDGEGQGGSIFVYIFKIVEDQTGN